LPAGLTSAVGVGTIVRVPLHGRRVRGWVLDADVSTPDAAPADLRAVLGVVSAGPPAAVVDLCRWAAWRWAGPLTTFLRAASPPNVVAPGPGPERETAVYPELLGPAHPWRTDAVVVVAPAGDRVLEGTVESLLAPEGSTIVVDPDAPRAARVAAALADDGRDVVVLGSEHDAAHRTRAWDRARAGACVVVAGRTGVWAPVPDLAAVVVLDDADEALEDERAPTWNARDVAVERARACGAPARVVSPAPTVDAVVALGAPGTAGPRPRWPRVEVVDPRDEDPTRGLLGERLADALRATVARGDQAVCVLNRVGRAQLLACNSCRELARCERCGATVLQRDDRLECAQCGTTRPLVCLHCHGSRFRVLRPGVARVRDDLAALLPRTDVAAVDASTDEHAALDAPVLVGTEAVLHRAPRVRVGLVAYLELDQELLAPRARAAEQALWLLVRGARLLGGERGHGRLLLQTRLPDHEVVRAALTSDPQLVVDAERARRRLLGFPPFGGVAELSGAPDAVAAACDALREVDGIDVLGPVARSGSTTSSRALVKSVSVAELCDALADPRVDAARGLGRLRIDVDPRRV